ncbi:MAG: geranylgeranyl reductase family protein [Cyanobacteria bacterium RI_101]|nr:geranylgeranyl reductase family protein [Cyanobacteria bacterium RI_101]
MTLYDCVILGAGPAGASAAYHLAKAGRSVLLLEKATLPRYKPCGGGVSPQIAQWFDFDFEPVISARVNEFCFTWKQGEEVMTQMAPGECIWMVRRDQFDYFLVRQALGQGAALQEGTKALGLNFTQDRWVVNSDQGPFQGRYLIAADGAKGLGAQWLGFRRRQVLTAGAVEIEPRLTVPHPQRAYFEFGLVNNGYVWNFPKADGYSLGSGVFNSRQRQSRDLIPSLERYSKDFGVDATESKLYGHPILLWNGSQTLHTQQALVAGEAAGVVDPFTAEGIRPSIHSALEAAKAVDRALGGDLDALANYTRSMATEWGGEMRWAQRLSALFYRFPRLSYQLGVQSSSGAAQMLRVFSGDASYRETVEKIQRKFTAKLGSAFSF